MTFLALGPYDHDKMYKLQVLKVWHMELCSMSCGSWMGGKFAGEWIHVYVWLNPFTVHLKLSHNC